jgi:hypothetical protein
MGDPAGGFVPSVTSRLGVASDTRQAVALGRGAPTSGLWLSGVVFFPQGLEIGRRWFARHSRHKGQKGLPRDLPPRIRGVPTAAASAGKHSGRIPRHTVGTGSGGDGENELVRSKSRHLGARPSEYALRLLGGEDCGRWWPFLTEESFCERCGRSARGTLVLQPFARLP